MSNLLKTKQFIFLIIFIVGALYSQSREYVESIHENGMPKIVTVVKESKNKIIVLKRTYWYENGQKQKEGTYQNGLWNGKWTYWNKKVYGMRKVNSKMENYMAYIIGTMIAGKNLNRKNFRMGFVMAKAFNGMKMAGNKLRESM